MDIFKSEKGLLHLIFKGYICRKDKGNNEKSYWRYTETKCLGWLQVVNNFPLIKETDHQHQPDAAKVQTKKVIQEIKEVTLRTKISSLSVLGTISAQVSDYIFNLKNLSKTTFFYTTTTVAGQLPAMISIKKQYSEFDKMSF